MRATGVAPTTSSVKMVFATTKSQPNAKTTGGGRLRLLAGALLLCLIALPVTYWFFLRKPPLPPETALPDVKRTYWQERIKRDVSDVGAYVTLGNLEERLGYFTAAVRYLNAARVLGASDEKVSGPLGRALLALARDDEALPELEKAARLQPNDLSATLNLAGLYVMQEHVATATTLLKRFTDAHPNMSSEDLRRIAFAQLECNNYLEAKAIADRMLSLNGNDMEAHSIAARSNLALNNLNEARKHTEALVMLSGGEASVRYLHGITLAALGQEDAAVAQWKNTVKQNPNALDAHERLGELFYKRGNYATAVQHFEILARRAPNLITTGRTADAYTKLKDKERAAYWRAVQVGITGDFKTALALAKIAEASKDLVIHQKGLQAAAEAYRGLRQKQPYLETMLKLTAGGTVDDLRMMARAYDELDRHEDRTRCLQQAVEKATDAQKPALLFDLAKAYRMRGMRDEAEKALEEACQSDPKTAALHRELAKVYFERQALDGRLAKAIHSWETAISLNATESNDWQSLGVAYAQTGEMAKALAALEHAIDLEPGSGPAYLELGRVYTKLGDKESAKQYNALYARYVSFDQERQTLRTRARRPGAPVRDLIAYGDLLTKMQTLDEAAQQYELALNKTPNDDKLRVKLASLYRRLRQPDKLALLMEKANTTAQPAPKPLPKGAL